MLENLKTEPKGHLFNSPIMGEYWAKNSHDDEDIYFKTKKIKSTETKGHLLYSRIVEEYWAKTGMMKKTFTSGQRKKNGEKRRAEKIGRKCEKFCSS